MLQKLVTVTSIAALSFAITGCDSAPEKKPQSKTESAVSESKINPDQYAGDEKVISELIVSEDLLLDLSPKIGQLAAWMEESFSSDASKDLSGSPFKNCLAVVGLKSESDATSLFHSDTHKPDFMTVAHWPIAESNAKPTHPWESLRQLSILWKDIKFGVIESGFIDEQRTRYELNTKVESRGSKESGDSVFGLKGHQSLVFSKQGAEWKLVEWVQEDLTLYRSPQTLFREVLAEVIPSATTLESAQRSYKDEMLLNWSKTGKKVLPRMDVEPWVDVASNHVFPSVAVVDYNNDGLDDLFLTARWGPTQMLKNQGDGTFVDVAEEIGLLEPYMVNCALFADLDNDGDQDVLLGRPMESLKYMRNNNGKYEDVTSTLSDLRRQHFVSSISVSDVNRDGLLDVYLTSYVPLNNSHRPFDERYLSAEERNRYRQKRVVRESIWADLEGAASVLLMNRGGGKLEKVPYDELLSQWRRAYQAVWADVDNDGDDDLYVCTDFAPNALLRNDTPKGAKQPVFVDAMKELVDGPQAFSMGGSWGDFDSDGDLDLYVSNMYSKAGKRIIRRVGETDERLATSAEGNFLFVNDEGVYRQAAGDEENQFAVHRVGWSYGGQWSDLDNDGYLDLYVPSGYFTAPKQIAGVDT